MFANECNLQKINDLGENRIQSLNTIFSMRKL